jgi:parallel beta-helix repeat protein
VNTKSLASVFFIAVILAGLLLVGTVQFSTVKASTDVTGLISSDTTWTLASSPYIVTGDVLVDAGVVLTIEQGVVVKFGSGTSLFVDGTLVVDGDEAHPVTFSSNKATPSPGDWGTINFRGSSAESIMKWAWINYASDGVTVTAGSPTLEHCSVSNNQRYGVYVSAGAPTIKNSTISNNGKDGIWNYVGTVTVTNCTISSNKGNGIYKDSASITLQDSVISNNLQSGVYGGAGGKFTVSNCTVSHNGHDGVTICYSNLAITDSEIAYNNRDGVRMESGTLSGTAKLTGNKISHNSGNGVYKSSGSMQLAYNNITFNNVGIAATPFKLVSEDSFQEQSGDTLIEYNNIINNVLYAVENIGPGTNTRGTVLNLTAINNWWGTTGTALIDQLIRDVKDDFSLGRVEYIPFLTEPASAPSPLPSPSPSPEPSPTPEPTPTPTETPSPSPIPVPGQSLFFVKSNSTVTQLFFNSTSAELSFTVNGTSGTSGYVEITIAKSLVSSIQDVKVYLDGDQLNVAISDDGDAWLLNFTYKHSTHQVKVSLAANEPEDTVPNNDLILIAIVVVIAVVAVASFMVWRKKKKT